MAKRFTDTDKWKKPFIRGLQGAYKLLWIYILDDCDHAGIWQVDLDVAEVRMGEKINAELALKSFGDKVIPFDDGLKWFIPDFIEFQYGALNPENRVHNSVITLLSKYKLLEVNKDLVSPLQGAIYKDKDKDKDSLTIYRTFKHLKISENEFNCLIESGYSKVQIDTILDAVENHKNNKNYTSLYLTSLNWLKKQFPEVKEKKAQPKPMTDEEYAAFMGR